MKPVSLSLHKNTVENRRKRVLAREAKQDVEKLIREKDVRAWAFIAIDADGGAHCRFDTGAVLPLWSFPATVAAIVQREIEVGEVNDDWKPALPIKGSS